MFTHAGQFSHKLVWMALVLDDGSIQVNIAEVKLISSFCL